jgi:hypothetical protein
MKGKGLVVVLLSVLFLSGCLTLVSPAKGRVLAVQGSEFQPHFPETDKLHYFVAVNVMKPSADPLYLDVAYENPCDSKSPITDILTLESKQRKVLLQSPAVDCVKYSRYYRVKVLVYDSSDRSREIDRITQKVYATRSSQSLDETLNP